MTDHRGRTIATAKRDPRVKEDRLYAHATTTCMIFPARAAGRSMEGVIR
jgi:acyl-coenzyme A thioesterase PaaI-like protein